MATSNAQGVRCEVSIVGRDNEGVRSVTATVSGEGEMQPEQAAADFLGFVAALPYEKGHNPRGRGSGW